MSQFHVVASKETSKTRFTPPLGEVAEKSLEDVLVRDGDQYYVYASERTTTITNKNWTRPISDLEPIGSKAIKERFGIEL